ncbi:hypothetical protein DM860_003992 [Cuscuta australis]|uniref:SGNH hydrolase-type esterase domain-containing protein n=1 Tax=Cuscuta australis TaxID=267555 RepID=A0A328CWT9_9ASTE|nr:hypothetical protein DM860_003992 [Cuscuta australis]
MEKRRPILTPTFFFFFFLCVLSVFPEVYCGEGRIAEVSPSTVMFVFGDSYADTGNTPNGSACWTEPYGITFPGKPSGRFSDGRVLTDFIATYLGIESPPPYRRRRRRWNVGGSKKVKDGVNFAYGGTGVFTTVLGGPNMSTQLDEFQRLVEQNVYTKRDLSSSLAHVSVAGNDYTTYDLNDDPQKNITDYAESVVSEIVVNLKRLHELGVGRVSVINVPPFGCLPKNATTSALCNDTINSSSELHNRLLKSAVEKLNSDTRRGRSTFLILDLYSAFMSALRGKKSSSFDKGLGECCRGTTSGSSCGDVDRDSGTKKYVVCEDPKRSFFWDTVHPSQQGWLSVFSVLAPSLHTFLFPLPSPDGSSSAAI